MIAKTRITKDPIREVQQKEDYSKSGAELIFHGRVRDMEQGKPITALVYEHYSGMAESELQKLAEGTVDKFSIQALECTHRVGEILVGEISLQVIIQSAHREEGLEAMAWFISKLKKDVPIWKNALLPDGSVIPSRCDHENSSGK